jgi:hypothetical protein
VDPRGVFRSPEDNEYVGDVSLNTLGDNVFDIMEGLVSVDPALAWRLGIRNTDTGDRFFTRVVAYNQTDTTHPWVEPPVDYQVSATIRVGAVPYPLALDPARASAHTNDDRSFVVIDPSCRRVVAKVPPPSPPIDMAVDSGAHIVYFSHTQASKIVNPVTHGQPHRHRNGGGGLDGDRSGNPGHDDRPGWKNA